MRGREALGRDQPVLAAHIEDAARVRADGWLRAESLERFGCLVDPEPHFFSVHLTGSHVDPRLEDAEERAKVVASETIIVEGSGQTRGVVVGRRGTLLRRRVGRERSGEQQKCSREHGERDESGCDTLTAARRGVWRVEFAPRLVYGS